MKIEETTCLLDLLHRMRYDVRMVPSDGDSADDEEWQITIK